jgi:ABC-2 type transport system permease protein
VRWKHYLKNMFTLYKKEINYYLNNPIGYIAVILFAVFANFLFVKDIFVTGTASVRPLFNLFPWLFLIFIPALSMGALAEEKRQNTIEVLLTLPLSETQIVLAKFLALLTITAIALLLTLGFPVSLLFMTKIYLPEIIIGYFGQLLFAGSIIALSLFFSNLTKNQIVAFLTSALTTFILVVLSTDFLATILPRFLQDFLSYYTPVYHLQNFIKGVVDFRSLFYFVSLMIIFLFLTIIDLEKRN